MNFRIIFTAFFLCFLIIQTTSAVGTEFNRPHGFEFGSSNKEAVNLIEASNKPIKLNEKDSDKVRRIVFDGALVETPVSNSNQHETRLEFFKQKLMSSAIYFKFEDDVDLLNAKEDYLKTINEELGTADKSEKMLSFEIWTWELPEIRVLLNSNLRNKSLMIEYIYEPVLNKKIAKELSDKRKGPPGDPAREMFLDGTYSKPKY